MFIFAVFIFSLLLSLKYVVDAFVFPVRYCKDDERDINTVSFNSYIPYRNNLKE